MKRRRFLGKSVSLALSSAIGSFGRGHSGRATAEESETFSPAISDESSYNMSALGPGLNRIGPNVFAFKDTCNVYAIVAGDEAILIDFGSGAILDKLPSIGVKKVCWILHTHFHRDQCQGDQIAKAQGIKIAVPAAERKYFENAESFWNEKKVFLLYDMRDVFLTLKHNISVDRTLAPSTVSSSEVFAWNGIQLKVLSTPGHTQGSLSFFLESGGERMLFCGDLLASAGKVLTMYDLEWQYIGTAGIEAEMSSINFEVRGVVPTLLLPSHGVPSRDPMQSTVSLLKELTKVYREYSWIRSTQWRPGFVPGYAKPVQLTKHIWQMRQVGQMHGVGYLFVADSGKAMLWDINAGETYALEEMQRLTGFTTIEWVGASHIHEDHVGGINFVKKEYGAKFWVMDHMVDVLEHPMAYKLPCLWPDPIKVDRVLHDEEIVVWEGIPMQFFYLPGQTDYTEGFLVEIDGKRLLFTGDNVAHPIPGTPLYGHISCPNYQKLDGGHVYSARKMLSLRLDFVNPQHFEWNAATSYNLESYLKSSQETYNAFRRMIDQPDPEIGVDNNWASFYPYQVEAKPGDRLRYELRIRNWIYRESYLHAAIRIPDNWSVSPSTVDLVVPAKSQSSVEFQIQVPTAEERLNRRFVVTADLWRDGEHLGELTETLVNMLPMKAH